MAEDCSLVNGGLSRRPAVIDNRLLQDAGEKPSVKLRYLTVLDPGGSSQNSGGSTTVIFARGKRCADSATVPKSHTVFGGA